jgi:50S ribosomal protein L16 3-hydroxylase
LQDPLALACALGEVMTAPKAQVWFEQEGADWDGLASGQSLMLDAKTRMMYDADHVFINGESYRAKGRDAQLMHLLADQRGLPASIWAKASSGALALLGDWYAEGWVHLVVELSGDKQQRKR